MRKYFYGVLVVLLAYSCAFPDTLSQSAKSRPAGRSVISPGDAKYLADGYDMLQIAASSANAIRGTCLTNLEVLRTVGESSTLTSYNSADSTYKLDNIVKFKSENSTTGNLFGVINGGGNLNATINSDFHIDSNTVVMVAIIDYTDSTVFLNTASLTPQAQLLYQTNRAEFEALYGTGYCDKAVLGERLVVAFSYKFKNTTDHSYQEYVAKAHGDFLGLVGASTDNSGSIDDTTFRNHTTITSHCYSTGSFVPNPVFTKADFASVVGAWTSYVNNVVGNPNGNLSVVKRVYQPYSKIINSTISTELDVYARMIDAWNKEVAKLMIIENDTTDTGVIQAAEDAITLAQSEIAKCKDRAADARYPATPEFPALEVQWIAKVSQPVYELKVTKPHINVPFSSTNVLGFTITGTGDIADSAPYYISVPATGLDQAVANLRSANPGLSIEYVKRAFSIPQTPIAGTVPVYCLITPDKASTRMTVDSEEANIKRLNQGYTVPAQGQILGYVLASSRTGLVPAYSVENRIDNACKWTVNLSTGTGFPIPGLGGAANTSVTYYSNLFTTSAADRDQWVATQTTTFPSVSLSGKGNFTGGLSYSISGPMTRKRTSTQTSVGETLLGYLPL